MFGTFNLDAMNETDVREVIVRPLLHELGYRQGTEATIKTEISFRYGKAFLGRKKPNTDPDLAELRGRADYICEVVSYGRWVVEAKAPGEALTIDDAQQAHTYAAHPEVAAIFYLLTNGREFRLYKTSFPDEPLLTWTVNETEERLMTLRNLLSPEAIKRRVHVPLDLGKPLGEGIGSIARIVGGMLVYERHTTDSPLLRQGVDAVKGLRASIVGAKVERNEEGQIVADVQVAGPYSVWDALNKAAGLNYYTFKTSDEYLSADMARPTIFQNLALAKIHRGTIVPKSPQLPAFTLPFDFQMVAYTHATGYLDGDHFKGTFEIDYDLDFIGVPPGIPISRKAKLNGDGSFEIVFR